MTCTYCHQPMGTHLIGEGEDTHIVRSHPACRAKFVAELRADLNVQADRKQVAGRITATLNSPLRTF